MKNNQWYEDNKDIILDLYYKSYKISDICNKLQCNKSMLYRKFKEWEIKRRTKIPSNERCNAKYQINYNYFDKIDTEHKAYWLGLIVSDGFVNNKELSLCLKVNDLKLIEDFKTDLKSEHPIKYNKDGNPFITISCVHLTKSLLEIGLHNRKSWDLDIEQIIQHIPKNLINHFVRGLFDGDGSIRYYSYSYLNKPQFHFGYTGLENVCNFVGKCLKINRKLVYEGNKTFTLVSRNPIKINEIYDYLYQNATIFLERKYNTFKEIQMMTFNDYNKAIS